MSPRGTEKEHGPIEIVWEAPPSPATRALTDYDEVLAAVKQRPGQWARLRVFVTGNIYTVRKGLAGKYTENRWEFQIVKNKGEDVWTLYARYRTPEQMEAAKRNGG
jgi:hypothetical protein